MISNRRSFITGIKGTKLNKKEVNFLKKYKPWGIILFKRNIKSLDQIYKLTFEIKKIFNDKNYPILIDEEGGRVSRITNIIDNTYFSAKFFGNLYRSDRKKFFIYYKIFIKQISFLLKKIGININSVPILDIRRSKSNKIIGDRSYSTDPKIVQNIGKFCIDQFHSNNIGTIIKHIPGHGLAKVDSHKSTPVINKYIHELNKFDFLPFKNQKSFFAMTAHIIYKRIDSNTATHSRKIIKIIRNKIKFKGIIMTDDISMKGLKFKIRDNTIKAFQAGCNLVLHCNANYSEMLTVAKNSPKLSRFIIKKTSEFYKILS